MYEVLRHASPAPLFVKTPLIPVCLDITTSTSPHSITVNPGTLVGMNQYGAHLSPRWGPDAASFDPRRFISKNPNEQERFQIPENAAYTA